MKAAMSEANCERVRMKDEAGSEATSGELVVM